MTTQQLSSKDVINCAKTNQGKLLIALGFDLNELQTSCPVHNGDNPTAFSYNMEKEVWSCFTHHCEDQYGNDIIGLIRAITGLSFNDTLIWAQNVLQGNEVDIPTTVPQHINDYLTREYDNNLILDEEQLQSLKKDYSFAINRGYSKELIEFFEARLIEANNRFVIPVRNMKGDLVGMTGRITYPPCPNQKCRYCHPDGPCPTENYHRYTKWIHYPKGIKTAYELYNINHAKDYIQSSQTAIVVEGPFDVWSLWSLGHKNTVACFGVSLSFEQCELLAKAGCLNLIVMLDSDKAGIKGGQKILRQTNRIFNTKIHLLKDGEDPGDLHEQFLF